MKNIRLRISRELVFIKRRANNIVGRGLRKKEHALKEMRITRRRAHIVLLVGRFGLRAEQETGGVEVRYYEQNSGCVSIVENFR